MKNFIFGIHSISEILKMRPQDVREIIVANNRTIKNLEKILNLAKQFHIPILYKEESWFKWARQMNHQGIVAEVRMKKESSLDDILSQLKTQEVSGFFLVLDEITDPHNVGALIRSAACAGVHAVILPKRGGSPLTSAVAKTSSGGMEHVAVIAVANINYALDRLKKEGVWVIGLAAEAEASLYEMPGLQAIALVVGNEEQGLRRLVRENCDQLIKIPMVGGMDSLNASVAGGIALFEVVRQRIKE
ncbi:MAG: 23S rRNA (guanosine(2251)-2'-O)-methyltransferase RlmB [Deltaproteobacteria bacterium]|nr:23S rRNA (guanosine(2251)-2'-O)-methyltransferase RlmB [Deltaproteobacteria bacterium]